MALNLVSLASSAYSAYKLNPVAMLYKIGAAIGVIALVYGSGYVTGCTHQKNSEAAKELTEERHARILENKDSKQGNVAAAQVRATENRIDKNTAHVQEEAKGKKLVECQQAPQPAKESEPQSEPKQIETDVVYLTPDAVRLYDLSIEPGLAGFRARAYETPRTVTVDEGFAVIAKNNGYCAKIAAQLDALITRIEQKQALSKE